MTTFEFTISEDYFIEANRRILRCRAATKYAMTLKIFIVAVLLGVSVFITTRHLYGVAVMLLVLIGIILSGPYVDEGRMRRRFRRHRQHNQRTTIELLENEVRSSSDQVKTQVLWTYFTKARHFEDGFLLFEGPTLIHWLPISAIASGSKEEAHQLIEANITDYKKV